MVQPGEFSRWVHEASTRISSLVRRESLALGENIVVEGTLAWEPLVQTHLVELIDYEYEHLAILNVEVPRDIAIEQARQRWWADRTSGTALGGRFMPDSAFDAFYPEHDGVSTCTRNARRMFEQADEIGAFSVELRFLHRTHGSTIHTSVMTAKDVEPWPIDSLREAVEFGASCARCGKPLRDRRSIRRGYGDGCWKLVH